MSYQNIPVDPVESKDEEDIETDRLLPSKHPDDMSDTTTSSISISSWIKRHRVVTVLTICNMGTLLYLLVSMSVRTASLEQMSGKIASQDASLAHNDDFKNRHDIPMPSGVNFGSWLSLEDYFYVGPTGAVEVATPEPNVAGVCLPPLHVGQAGAPDWQAETDLLSHLLQTVGIAQAVKIFHAHRTSFVTEWDFRQLSRWGVKHVRVPLSWCFTDAHPDDIINVTRTDDEAYADQLVQQFTCRDPFYSDAHQTVVWPAIPRSTVTQLLRLCAKYGITASLDLHTYPGATSLGTFSGLWPRPPRFWQHDDPESAGDIGRQLLRNFITWMESLADTDPAAFAGLRGVSPMNEPAHLAGLFRHTDRDFLPPLPRDQADVYLQQLNGNHSSGIIPDGPHLRVLRWLQDATDIFRASKLPGLGKQLHLNVHESFLSPEAVRKDIKDEDDAKQRHNLIAAWWNQATSHKERTSWAVLDMHHYHAWDASCMGASDGPPAGNYTCSNADTREETLARCTEWASMFRKVINEHCGEGAQLMSGEFSTSTHHRIRHACNDIDTLEASYLAQMKTALAAKVEMYYWSYKMPFGGAFKAAWSFSQLMYLLGVSDRPDWSTYNCGEHTPSPSEVTDDIFG